MADLPFLIFEFFTLITATFTIAFAIYAFRKREIIGATVFGFWMVAVSGWLISHIFLFFMETTTAIQLGLRVELVFQALVPATFLLYALQYTNRSRWFKSWRVIFPFIIPLFTILLSWTPLADQYIWLNLTHTPSNIWIPISYNPGPVYWIFWVYVYFCLLISVRLFFQYTKFCSAAIRNQCNTLAGAMLIPLFTYSWHLILPGNPVAFNGITFGVGFSGLIIGFAIFRYRLFDISPVAYHELLQNLKDGVMIIDASNRLIQINQKAAELLEVDADRIIGEPLNQSLSEKSPWVEILTKEFEEPIEIMQAIDLETRYFEINITQIQDQTKKKERLVFIQDITNSKLTEIAAKNSKEIAEVRAMELDVLRTVAEKLNRSVEIADVTSSGLEQIVKSVGARFGYVILNNGNGRPRLVGSYQMPEILKNIFSKYPYCPSCKSFERFMAGEYQEPVAFIPCPIMDEVSMSYPGSLSIPLHLGERQLGILTLIMAPQAVFSGDEINLLQTIGDQYSAAVERAGLFENAEYLATVDSLTGLYNRRFFFQAAQKEFARTKRYGHPVTIVMLDIDFFKYVNDKFGHLVGDYVLQQVADRCKSVLRSSDMIGRYGGEEFVILLPETDLEQAKRIADRIRQLVMNRPIVTERGDVSLTVSLGLACLEPGLNNNLEQILDFADQALYRAKALGRNRIQDWQASNANPSLLNLDQD